MDLNQLKESAEAFLEANDIKLTMATTRQGLLIYDMTVCNASFAGISMTSCQLILWPIEKPELRTSQRALLAWALLHGIAIDNKVQGLTDG